MSEKSDVTIKVLENMVSKLSDDMPMFRGVPITNFEKDEVISICRLFANEMYEYQQKYLDILVGDNE